MPLSLWRDAGSPASASSSKSAFAIPGAPMTLVRSRARG